MGTIQIPFTIKVKRLYHILFALTFKLLLVPRFHRTKSYFTLPPTPGTAGFIFIFFASGSGESGELYEICFFYDDDTHDECIFVVVDAYSSCGL